MLRILSYTIAISLVVLALGQSPTENDRPIIGLVTTPSDFVGGTYDPSAYSYFRASYVKWLESGGCRVTPIPWNLDQEEMESILGDINGVVFSGGWSGLEGINGADSPYTAAARFIINYAINQNNLGTYYPVFGVDEGFQAITLVISNNPSIFGAVNLATATASLQLTSSAYAAKMFASYPSYLLQYVESNPVFWFNLTQGVDPNVWSQNQNLTSYFNVLATSTDPYGNTFVSAFEGKTLPIYAVQFHPEKGAFDWDSATYNHEYKAIQAAQLLINRFVDESRNNANVYPTPSIEDSCLIYNTNTTILPQFFAPLYFFANNATSCLSNAGLRTLELGAPENVDDWEEWLENDY